MSTKDLIKRIEALENAGGRAPGYLVEMLRNEMVQAGIDYQLPPNMSTGDCLARLIELKPD